MLEIITRHNKLLLYIYSKSTIIQCRLIFVGKGKNIYSGTPMHCLEFES